MKTLGIIILTILSIILVGLTVMSLYVVFFMALPDFYYNLKDKYEDFKRNKR